MTTKRPFKGVRKAEAPPVAPDPSPAGATVRRWQQQRLERAEAKRDRKAALHRGQPTSST